MIRIKYLTLLILFCLSTQVLVAKDTKLADGLYAHISTTKGDFTVSLFYDEMPISVGNFLLLAEGKQKGDLLKVYQKTAFYNNSVFDKKVGNYFINTSNPDVADSKGIGYTLPLESNDSLSALPNILCVTSGNGENNGSKLQVVFKPLPFFSNANIPVGRISQGVETAQTLEKGDQLVSVRVERVGKQARKFKAAKAVEEGVAEQKENEARYAAQEFDRTISALEQLSESNDKAYQHFANEKLFAIEKAEVLPSGVRMIKSRETEGVFPQKGQSIRVNYTGYLADGSIFGTSFTDPRPILITLGEGQVIKGWEEILPLLRVGEKATIIVPSSSAYGRNGAGSKIPPYTTLIFDITLDSIEE